MPKHPDRLHELERQLAEALGKVVRTMQPLADGREPREPDLLMQQVDAHTCELGGMIGTLMAAADEGTTAPRADLAVVVGEELQRLRAAAQMPLVVQTCLLAGLPLVPVRSDRLRAAIDQLLLGAMTAAGHGGSLQVQTRASDDQVTVEITAGGGEHALEPSWDGLRQAAAALGGSLATERTADGSLRARMHMPTLRASGV